MIRAKKNGMSYLEEHVHQVLPLNQLVSRAIKVIVVEGGLTKNGSEPRILIPHQSSIFLQTEVSLCPKRRLIRLLDAFDVVVHSSSGLHYTEIKAGESSIP